jgi:hypothetical protein
MLLLRRRKEEVRTKGLPLGEIQRTGGTNQEQTPHVVVVDRPCSIAMVMVILLLAAP